MKIRPAKRSDYKQLVDLYNKFVGYDRYSKLDNDSFFEVLKNKKNFILIAEINGKLVGFITFSIRTVVRYPRPIVEMDELYVEPEYRRLKLGKKLVAASLKKSKQLGCYRMFVESHYKHKAAHKFYEKLGFTNYGYHFIKDIVPKKRK